MDRGLAANADRLLSITGLAENGLLVSSKDADALPSSGEPVPDQSFEVTVAGGESASP